jgi:hypothetical protein
LGPAAVLSHAIGFWAVLHLVAAIGLPAALLFRARYRAYDGARYILVSALAATLPFVGYCMVGIGAGVLALKIASAIALVAIGLSLLGFMGSETTVAGQWMAFFVVVTVSGHLGCEVVFRDSAHAPDRLSWIVASSLAFAAATTLGALGLFQLLARRHWDEARSVDVRSVERPPIASLSGESMGNDSWQTRD